MTCSIVEGGDLPVAELARISEREGWRPAPTYQAHRWFARRLSSSVRGLLVGTQTSTLRDFWKKYRNGIDLSYLTILDPFVGGGTSVIEAQRLGANTIGLDIDAVACAITSFETRAYLVPDLEPALKDLSRTVGRRLARYYRTRDVAGRPRVVLHYFWVQRITCGGCAATVDAHPHYQLAYDAEGHHQWVFCPSCTLVARLPKSANRHKCTCGVSFSVKKGIVTRGVLTCPHCKREEALIEIARRTKSRPRWHLFALETLPESSRARTPLAQRTFQRATEHDRQCVKRARCALARSLNTQGRTALPSRPIPKRHRSDNRLVAYGYRDYLELFNARQLLHLSLLARAISQYSEPVREALMIAFSDHLTTNCMMTNYAFGWRRLAPLFSVRAFRHVPRPVEINPWLDGIGRGTYPNTVRQVMRCVHSAKSALTGLPSGALGSRNVVFQRDSRDLSNISDGTIDLILTDPPYFDNIVYSELSDFFIPWLKYFGLIRSKASADKGLRRSIASVARRGPAVAQFATSLRTCFKEMARVLKPGGRIVFTYQHSTPQAWEALLAAIANQGMRVLQVFPILGNSAAGPHIDEGTCQWDAVFVLGRTTRRMRKLTVPKLVERAAMHWRRYVRRLNGRRTNKVPFGVPDQLSFLRACIVAAAVGMFARSNARDRKALAKHIQTPFIARAPS